MNTEPVGNLPYAPKPNTQKYLHNRNKQVRFLESYFVVCISFGFFFNFRYVF